MGRKTIQLGNLMRFLYFSNLETLGVLTSSKTRDGEETLPNGKLMFPEEGLITENARNVTFHLLLFLFSHSTTVVCTRMASSKPLPHRTPQPRRSRRLRGQEPSTEPSPERVVRSAASSPFGGPVSPNGENPSPSHNTLSSRYGWYICTISLEWVL